MELAPYYLGLALACIVVSIGLQNRPAWMWYLGWVVLYLYAAYIGQFFFSALYFAANPTMECFAFIYLAGGLLLWMPATIWWATHRHLFGAKAKVSPKSPASTNTPPSSP